MRIAQEKLHFDLYEKRFAIFEAARKLIGEAIKRRTLTQPILELSMHYHADRRRDPTLIYNGVISCRPAPVKSSI